MQVRILKLFKIITNKLSYFYPFPGLVFLVSYPWELILKSFIFVDINATNVTSQAAPLCLFAQSKPDIITAFHAVASTKLLHFTLCQLVSPNNFPDVIRIFALEHIFISVDQRVGKKWSYFRHTFMI